MSLGVYFLYFPGFPCHETVHLQLSTAERERSELFEPSSRLSEATKWRGQIKWDEGHF